jgi:hypothetical protein
MDTLNIIGSVILIVLAPVAVLIIGVYIAGVLSLMKNTFFNKGKNAPEYIEPNEYITVQECLDLYNDDKRVVINNGQVTEII